MPARPTPTALSLLVLSTLSLIASVSAITSPAARAQDAPAAVTPSAAPAEPPMIRGTDNPEVLPTIEITASRRASTGFGSPRATNVETERVIQDRQARSAPEALRETPGVMVQQTAYGQGSPFIRGLTGNQVLTLIDGVRLNNSTFRFGANQYLATVDPFTIGRIEVVRGPGSVLYGSDALGGTVQVLTRSREDRSRAYDIEGGLIGRYGSASRELTGRVEAEGNVGGLGFNGGATFSDFDDLSGGRTTGVQPNTGYRTEAADVKASYASGSHEVTLAYQYLRQFDVPRSDRLNLGVPPSRTTPASVKFVFEPQRRNLAILAYAFEDADAPISGVRSNVSFHRQEEGRAEVTSANRNRETEDFDWVETWGTAHTVEVAEVARQVVTAGVELYRDHVASRRTQTTLSTGVTAVARPRFADGGTYATLGAFVQDEVRIIPDAVHLTLGGRYTRIEVDGDYTDPTAGRVDIDQTHDAFTGAANLWISPIPEIAIVGGVMQGFRAPNFDDLSVFGSAGSALEVPNPDLDPERSLGSEVGLKWRVPGSDPLLAGSIFGHYTVYEDLIQRAPGTLDGLPFVDGNGNGVQDPGEPAVLTRQNVGKAHIGGMETELRLRLPEVVSLGGERWTVFGHWFWTYGSDTENDRPVRGIPPSTCLAGIRTDWEGGRYWIEGVGTFVRDQERLGAGDLTDARIPPGGTPGYEVYTLRGGARFRLFRGPAVLRADEAEKDYNAEASVAVENILDRDYRVHGSGVNGPGTNFVASVGLRF